MHKNKQRNKHGLKILRRFRDDIWDIWIRRNKKSRTGLKVLTFLSEAHMSNEKYRVLLKDSYYFFKDLSSSEIFKKRRNKKFLYKVTTQEDEYKRPPRLYRTKEYLNNLKLRRFYGNITKKKFKQLFKESSLNSNFLGKSFICLLESRLDILLYRGNFFESVFSARQYVLHQGVYVNGVLVYKPSYMIKLNTFVFLKNINFFYDQIIRRIKKEETSLFRNYPEYLEVNYKIGCLSIYKNPEVKEVPFPFFLNYKNIAYNFFK